MSSIGRMYDFCELMRGTDRIAQLSFPDIGDARRNLLQSLQSIYQDRLNGIQPICHTIHTLLNADPILSLSADNKADIVELASATQCNPGDKPGLANTGAMTLEAVGGERSRLVVYVSLPEHGWSMHLLGTLRNSGGSEPLLSLRVLHGDCPETPLIAWRRDGHVLFSRFHTKYQWHNTPRLFSIFRLQNEVRVYIDGVLQWTRDDLRCEDITGFNLDLTGVNESPVAFDVHWLEVARFSDDTLSFTPNDFDVPSAAITQSLLNGAVPALTQLVYALPNCPLLMSEEDLATAIIKLTRDCKFYPEQAVQALLRCLSNSAQQKVKAQLQKIVPPPVLSATHMGVSLLSNASKKFDVWRMIRGEKSEDIQILKDINFNVFPEDIIGVIGRNGAGKSTLLRAVTGAIPISEGSIGVNGSPILLRPGAGMAAELTGRDNIIRAGLYMGLSTQEIADIMDEVIEFSELSDHIDRPYSYYSDGMRSRLIFSLATCTSPEILMLDELLSAGDTAFQEKAMKRLDEFLDRAQVVIVVQHGMDFVLKRCTKCLYLRQGKQVFFGDPSIASEMYNSEA